MAVTKYFNISKKRLPAIVVNGQASEPLHFAADELRRYIGRIFSTDARVRPMASARKPAIQFEIVEDDVLTDEGYALVAENKDLFYIRAGGASGAVFGVYDFLRRYAGCRFSGYAPDGELVPRLDNIKIPVGAVRMKPELWYRGLQFYPPMTDPRLLTKRLDWMAKNGMNYVMLSALQPDLPKMEDKITFDPETNETIVQSTNREFAQTDVLKQLLIEVARRGLKLDVNHHNLFYWLPPEKYFAEHPEWYALIDGERSCKALQLCVCTSNRQAVAALIENILQYLRNNPVVRIVGVIPEDGVGMCQCEECRKLDIHPEDAFKKYEGGRLRTPDGENRSKIHRYALLLNEVARAVRREFPHVKVGASAYVDMQWPPRVVKLESNIVVWVAMYWRCGAHELSPDACRMNRFFLDILKQWRLSQTCHIILYEYYQGMNCQKGLPYPMGDVICREWPRLKALGIGGATIQSREQCHNTYALNYQAFAQSGWGGDVDYETLKTEFLKGMFGSLADIIRPVYDILDQQVKLLEITGSDSPFIQPVPPAVGCLLPNARNIAFLLEPLDIPKTIAQIESAMSKTKNEFVRRQAVDFLDALRYWDMAANLYSAAQAITEAENRREYQTVEWMAQQALEKNYPVLKRLEVLPPRGWIRLSNYLSAPRGWFWYNNKWGELPWLEKKTDKE